MTSKEFRQARLDLGLTQKQLAAMLGMTQQGVNRIENTRHPTKQQSAGMRLVIKIMGGADDNTTNEDCGGRV